MLSTSFALPLHGLYKTGFLPLSFVPQALAEAGSRDKRQAHPRCLHHSTLSPPVMNAETKLSGSLQAFTESGGFPACQCPWGGGSHQAGRQALSLALAPEHPPSWELAGTPDWIPSCLKQALTSPGSSCMGHIRVLEAQEPSSKEVTLS